MVISLDPRTDDNISMNPSAGLHDRARTTCVVVDDHPPIIDCLSRYLSAAGFTVLGTAAFLFTRMPAQAHYASNLMPS